MIYKRLLLNCVPLAISAAFLTSCELYSNDQPDPPLFGASIGGSFKLTNSANEVIEWKDFEGQYRIVYFGFTYCPDVCPTDVQRLSQGLMEFERDAPNLGKKITPIFISIDPERDTPEIMGEFISNFHPRLVGLTGSTEAIAEAAQNFAIYYARGQETPAGGYLVDHSAVVYLFDPQGRPLATLPTDKGSSAVASELEKWVS
jgi:protein SCO1/2